MRYSEPHAPLEGFSVPMKRVEVVIGFDDGTTITEPFNLLTKDGDTRQIVYVEVDGRRFELRKKYTEKDYSWMSD